MATIFIAAAALAAALIIVGTAMMFPRLAGIIAAAVSLAMAIAIAVAIAEGVIYPGVTEWLRGATADNPALGGVAGLIFWGGYIVLAAIMVAGAYSLALDVAYYLSGE